MVSGIKNGRLAHEQVRDQARALAELYRKVSDSEDGKYCFNPDDEIEDQQWVDTSQALAIVLTALERFAESGSFALSFDIRKFGICEEYESSMLQDMNRGERIDFLSDKHAMSRSTIERTIRGTPEKKAAVAERAANATEIAKQAAKAWAARKR